MKSLKLCKNVGKVVVKGICKEVKVMNRRYSIRNYCERSECSEHGADLVTCYMGNIIKKMSRNFCHLLKTLKIGSSIPKFPHGSLR